MKAVVVLSGGQDSATCLALAIRKYGVENVAAITFAYGQRHAVETKFAKRLTRLVPRCCAAQRGRDIPVACKKGSLLHKIVHLDFYKHLTTNALFDHEMKISKGGGEDKRQETRDADGQDARRETRATSNQQPATNNQPPNTVVEGRNAIFLQLAAVWAKTLGATEVYTGVSETDFSGYPDCRAAFIRAEEKAIRLALNYPIRIVTPFMHMTKADEWVLADKLGIFDLIRNETVTCYNGIPGDGCGKCPACRLRNRGLKTFLQTKGTRHSCRVNLNHTPLPKGTRHSCRVRK